MIAQPRRIPQHRLPRPEPAIGGPDLILFNGKIWTGEAMAQRGRKATPAKFAQAVAIANGRILAVGPDSGVRRFGRNNTQVIDLRGCFAMPGFIDSHAHFMDGSFQLLSVKLKDVKDEAEFVRRIQARAGRLARGRWLLGGDWDEQAWPGARLPTRWMIDSATPKNPIFLSRYDGHEALANSLALKSAGITKRTPDPVGGEIVRDAATGEPTGVLKDAAQDLVARIIPPPSEADALEALEAGLAEARRHGVTGVHDINLGSNTPGADFAGELRLLRRLEAEQKLTCRFYEIIPLTEWKRLADAGIGRGMGADFIKLGALKAFADGSLGSQTAWFFEPYDNRPRYRGLPLPLMNPPAKMEGLAREANAAGLQLAIHAIGDRAVAEILDLYQKLGGRNPAAPRFRIEHAQHVRPEDFARFGRMGIIASMQPYHAVDDGRWAEKLIGRKRARTSYAWRSMLEARAPVAFGTDWPVAPLNPLLTLHAALTRVTLDGRHPGGWIPQQAITGEQALRAYTAGSAYAAFEESDCGTVAVGKRGDLVVLSENLLKIPPEEIPNARVLLTVVGGRIVYRND